MSSYPLCNNLKFEKYVLVYIVYHKYRLDDLETNLFSKMYRSFIVGFHMNHLLDIIFLII